ncbi:MAG: GtrA family protein [Oscillospiraceae bacterium]
MNFKKKIGELLKKYGEQISYLFFGGLTTVVSFVTFYIFCKMSIDPVVSNILSWVISVTFAYITNRIFVFKSEKKGKNIFLEMISFFASRITSGVIETGIIYVFVSLFDNNEFIVKAIATILTIIMNYILSKLFVFKTHKK